jgi:DNA-binding response OmpR family regulator
MVKIAIIEDDQAISQMYRIKFESVGFTVETAENGRLGLEMVENLRPDIVLLDLMMPEMSGDEMLIQLRKKPWGVNMPVIILTNVGEQEIPDIVRQLGVNKFILKADMTPKQVVDLVKTQLPS